MKKLIYSFLLIDVIIFALLAMNGGLHGAPFDLKPQEFKEHLAPEAVTLIDVRTDEEYQDIRIHGASNVDYTSADFLEQIAYLDKTEPIYLYCRSGLRAARAQRKMKKMGFEKVYNLKGGLIGWYREGYATVSKPGFNFASLMGHEGC
jgi:rhodanese-related sulfurtransferase